MKRVRLRNMVVCGFAPRCASCVDALHTEQRMISAHTKWFTHRCDLNVRKRKPAVYCHSTRANILGASDEIGVVFGESCDLMTAA